MNRVLLLLCCALKVSCSSDEFDNRIPRVVNTFPSSTLVYHGGEGKAVSYQEQSILNGYFADEESLQFQQRRLQRFPQPDDDLRSRQLLPVKSDPELLIHEGIGHDHGLQQQQQPVLQESGGLSRQPVLLNRENVHRHRTDFQLQQQQQQQEVVAHEPIRHRVSLHVSGQEPQQQQQPSLLLQQPQPSNAAAPPSEFQHRLQQQQPEPGSPVIQQLQESPVVSNRQRTTLLQLNQEDSSPKVEVRGLPTLTQEQKDARRFLHQPPPFQQQLEPLEQFQQSIVMKAFPAVPEVSSPIVISSTTETTKDFFDTSFNTIRLNPGPGVKPTEKPEHLDTNFVARQMSSKVRQAVPVTNRPLVPNISTSTTVEDVPTVPTVPPTTTAAPTTATTTTSTTTTTSSASTTTGTTNPRRANLFTSLRARQPMSRGAKAAAVVTTTTTEVPFVSPVTTGKRARTTPPTTITTAAESTTTTTTAPAAAAAEELLQPQLAQQNARRLGTPKRVVGAPRLKKARQISSPPNTSTTSTTAAVTTTTVAIEAITTNPVPTAPTVAPTTTLPPPDITTSTPPPAPAEDPCTSHTVLADQPERSFNHHLSLNSSPLTCDRDLTPGWYRFKSPAGDLMPTECPGGNYCGANMPVWMKGSIPSFSEGIVDATGCVTKDRECCSSELPLQVRNCTDFVVYKLHPTPTCQMGYCVGEGVKCPEGMASANGYTPCKFSVKLVDVVVTSNNNSDDDSADSSVAFYCHPLLKEVTDPKSVVVEVEWWVDDTMVSEESFGLDTRSVGRLTKDKWKKDSAAVRCVARAKHAVVGAKTDSKSSIVHKPSSDTSPSEGLEIISSGPLVLHEGGAAKDILVRSVAPIPCVGKNNKNCCLELDLEVLEQSQHCPNGRRLERLELPSCEVKICQGDANRTVAVPVRVKEDHLINGDETLFVAVRIKKGAAVEDGVLQQQKQEVRIVGSLPEQMCRISPHLSPFSGADLTLPEPGVYTVLRSADHPVQVQVHYRSCSLGDLCACAVAVRVADVVVIFDVCTKGHLQVWAWENKDEEEQELPEGFQVISVDEGREYKVLLPSGTFISLGSMLNSVRIFASKKDSERAEGLCSGKDAAAAGLTWRNHPKESLFTAYFDPTLNSSLPVKSKFCSDCNNKNNNNCTKAPLGCIGDNAETYLSQALHLGKNGDFLAFTDLKGAAAASKGKSNHNKDSGKDLLKTGEELEEEKIFLSISGPVREPPSEGWTMTSADKYCSDFIRSSSSADVCRAVPDIDLASVIAACRTDLLFSGDSRVAGLHLDRLKQECRFSLYRNTSLWEKDAIAGVNAPPRRIADALCLNDCSGINNGVCDRGVCNCSQYYAGPDCSQSILESSAAAPAATGGNPVPTPPQISALANFGLCDVRSSPCRDLVVLGDGMVKHDSLSCVFEVYKIRGVASKQLVSDAVLTVPARFVSYQQVVCPLPLLEIHNPDQVVNFDLKDNTDRTRVFSQITLSYGSGPRSAPVDLLLYDSQCWDCAPGSGECKAKVGHHRCFFAAAATTSSLQVFRIGRTISTRVSQDDFRTCTLPKDSGGCDNKIFRYYYNAIERRCKLFVYGGCKGNGNNFLSEIQCLQRCGDESQLALLPVPDDVKATTEIDTCSLTRDEGICPGNVPRFYFNKGLGRCELFSYGGCGGNTNNFITQEECVSHCGGPAEGEFTRITSLQPVSSKCRLPVNKGSCQATLRRFYFDENMGTCKLFIFGGCQGNANNFETMEDCIESCSGPGAVEDSAVVAVAAAAQKNIVLVKTTTKKEEEEEEKQITATTTTTTTIRSVQKSSSSSISSNSVCDLPATFGTCLSVTFRFHFDKSECKRFKYSGCGGNANNFLTEEDCEKTCKANKAKLVLEEDTAVTEVKIRTPKVRVKQRKRLFEPTRGKSTTTTTAGSNAVEEEATTTTTPGRYFRQHHFQQKGFVEVVATATTTTEAPVTTATTSNNSSIDHNARLTSHARSLFNPSSRSRFSPPTTTTTTTTASSTTAAAITTTTTDGFENNETEDVQIRTQTSRSVVVRARVAKGETVEDLTVAESVAVASKVEVLPLPPSASNSGLVVIRSYCRFPPPTSSSSGNLGGDAGSKTCKAVDSEITYFYNVTTAECEPLSVNCGGSSSKSRNKFNSLTSCREACVVKGGLN